MQKVPVQKVTEQSGSVRDDKNEASARRASDEFAGLAPATDKQRRVLDAAMEIFADKGFAGASTAEIAKRAGVAEGTIFKQYKTKKDLLIGVVAPVFARFVAPTLVREVRDILDEDHADIESLLTKMYVNRMDFIRTHERVMKIAIQEFPFHPEVRELGKEVVLTHLWPSARACIERLQRRGAVREGDPASIIRMVIATLFSFFIMRSVIAPERHWDDDAELRLMIDTLAQGLKPPR